MMLRKGNILWLMIYLSVKVYLCDVTFKTQRIELIDPLSNDLLCTIDTLRDQRI